MAHELTMRRSGKVEMAYTGEQPWHGLGTKLPIGASEDEWIHAAGMEWQIAKAPVSYEYNGERIELTDRVALHRSDNGMPLGLVSTSYNVVQPSDEFHFFRDLVQSVGLGIETAGTLFGGRRFWVQALIGEEAMVGNRDLVRGHLLLATSADGSLRTRAKVTSTRVVCHNTLTAALGNADEYDVKVSHQAKFMPDTVKQILGVAPKSFENFMADMRRLANTQLTEPAAELMTKSLLGRSESVDNGPNVDAVMDLFRGKAVGFDEPGFAGTPWGWINSVTEFFDHDRKAISDSHRLNTALFGTGDRLKTRARDMALKLLAPA